MDCARERVSCADACAFFGRTRFILGGAVSERFDEFAPHLHSLAQIRPAQFAGQAGVIGAALAAVS